MKQWMTLVLVSMALAGVLLYSAYQRGYDRGKSEAITKCDKLIQNYEKETKRIQDSLQFIFDGLSDTILALQNQKQKIIIKYKLIEKEIDSLISQDSTQSIPQYRLNMNVLGVSPDETTGLTYREIGFGAKFFTELRAKREEKLILEEIDRQKTEQLTTMNEALKSSKRENELQKLKHKQEIEQMKTDKSFWEDRFPLVIGGGLGYDFNHKQVMPIIGVIWGVRIN